MLTLKGAVAEMKTVMQLHLKASGVMVAVDTAKALVQAVAYSDGYTILSKFKQHTRCHGGFRE
jgi:hypothetical protein